MSTHRLLVLLVGLVSLSNSAAFGEARCPGDIETIRYHSLSNSQIGVPVMINESGPFEFILDTGALITILEPSLAAELHLASAGHAGLVSDVRRAVVDMVRLETVETGGHSIQQPLAVVQSLVQIQAANPRVRGILGENFLSRFDLLIDHAHNILCLDPSGQMQNGLRGEHIPLVVNAGPTPDSPLPQPLLVAVLLGENSRKAILRLDSGANVPQLYVNTLDTAPWMQRKNALRGQVTGTAAEYFALTPFQNIHIGEQVLRDIVFAMPLKTKNNVHFDGEDGLLPTVLFKRVFISHTDRFVILNPR